MEGRGRYGTPDPPLRVGMRWRVAGLLVLVRWIPVASWIGGSIAIGLGAALGRLGRAMAKEQTGVSGWDVALIVLAGVLLQGLAAHAFNDREDWRSGTDPASPGRLSGGSKAVPRGLLGPGQLAWTGLAAVAAGALPALHFTWRTGPGALILWLIAAWAAGSYSLPPLRLSYRPLLGEWLAAWPAVVAATAGTFYLLTGGLLGPVVVAGAVHGLFCLAWLMQHHLADIPADLAANPVKLTTPAWLYRRGRCSGGPGAERHAAALARLPGMAYFSLAAVGSAVAVTLPLGGPAFGVPALLGAFGLLVTSRARVDDVADITRRELCLISLSFLEAASLAAGLALAGR